MREVKIIFITIVLTVVFAVIAFFTPNPKFIGACWWNEKYRLDNIVFTIILSCDSPEYMRLVIKFPKGYDDNNTRLNRPLYPLLAYPVYLLVRPVIKLPENLHQMIIQKMADIKLKNAWANIQGTQILAAAISTIIINIILASLAVYFFLKGLEYGGTGGLKFYFAILIYFSFIFKNFVLIPHTLMFDLLIPAVLFFISMKSLNTNKKREKLTLIFIGAFIMGLLFLGKGLWYSALVIMWLSIQNRHFKDILISILLLLLPTILYIAILYISNIPYYNYEITRHREGVWMFDSFKSAGFISTLSLFINNMQKLLVMTINTFRYELIFIIILLILNIKNKYFPKLINRKEIYFCTVYFFSWFCFWLWVGYFEPRNLYTLYPVIILILSKFVIRLSFIKKSLFFLSIYIIQFTSTYFLFLN